MAGEFVGDPKGKAFQGTHEFRGFRDPDPKVVAEVVEAVEKKPKPITSSALYPMFYIAMGETCRKYGYALAVHGSLGRDFDLIAAPWTEEAVDAETLVQKLVEECELMEGNNTNTAKPCGRKCYVFVAFGEYRAGYIDLSIMPKVTAS